MVSNEATAPSSKKPTIKPPHLFHLTTGRLGPGSIIEAGNWGRLLRRYENDTATGQLFGQVWILTRELVLELERERNFRDKPSRMLSTFSFRTREHADQYRAEHDRPGAQVLHRVELVDPAATRHEASVAMLRWPAKNTSFLDIMTAQAEAYWRGDGDGVREVVSLSALRVLECLE